MAVSERAVRLAVGTYNNQYMVIDLKRIRLSERISDGALWVVEQIPGLVEGGDQTDILRTGERRTRCPHEELQASLHTRTPVDNPHRLHE